MTNNIRDFDQNKELIKMIKLRTSGSINIRNDVIKYALLNINRKDGLFSIAEHISFPIAKQIENGIFELSLILTSNEKPDSIEFIENIYRSKIIDICLNIDMNNIRINNKTLKPWILEGGLDPHFLAFIPPEQVHPARWFKELERRRTIEMADSNKKVTDIYKCRKCGDRKSTTVQIQTRSADEPMTIFVTCVTCHNTFTA